MFKDHQGYQEHKDPKDYQVLKEVLANQVSLGLLVPPAHEDSWAQWDHLLRFHMSNKEEEVPWVLLEHLGKMD